MSNPTKNDTEDRVITLDNNWVPGDKTWQEELAQAERELARGPCPWDWKHDPANPYATPSPQITILGIFFGDDWQLADWQKWYHCMEAARGAEEARTAFNREAQRIGDSYAYVLPPGFVTDKYFLAWLQSNGLLGATSGGGLDRVLANTIGSMENAASGELPPWVKYTAIAAVVALALNAIANTGILSKKTP